MSYGDNGEFGFTGGTNPDPSYNPNTESGLSDIGTQVYGSPGWDWMDTLAAIFTTVATAGTASGLFGGEAAGAVGGLDAAGLGSIAMDAGALTSGESAIAASSSILGGDAMAGLGTIQSGIMGADGALSMLGSGIDAGALTPGEQAIAQASSALGSDAMAGTGTIQTLPSFGDSGAIPMPGLTPSSSSGLGKLASYIPAAASIGQGLLGLGNANKLQDQSTAAAKAADPFADQRSQYAVMLQKLMNDPAGQTAKDPWYQSGLDAVQRSMGAQGYGGSGNMAVALQKYGSDSFNSEVATLSQLAGANFNNAPAAAQIGQQGQVNATNLQGQALNSLAYGTQLAFGK